MSYEYDEPNDDVEELDTPPEEPDESPTDALEAESSGVSTGPRRRITLATRDAVYKAERAGQRSACGLGPHDDLNEDLELALERRIEVNLQRTGGEPIASVAGDDPEVVELESVYRKPRGASDDASALEQLPSGSLDHHTPEEE